MDKATFWTVFKADLLFSVCSITVVTLFTILITLWKKRRKPASAPAPLKGPRALMIGGMDPAPGHCPLCGQDWPLPGPVGPPKQMP
jgi:hypothetical protein